MADIFGSRVDAIEKSTRASLSRWAQANVDASGNKSLSAKAVTKLLEIQHDLLFRSKVTAAELVTVAATATGLYASQFWILMPFSRGSVHLGSADKIDEPVIDLRLYLTEFDLALATSAGRLARKFWRSKPVNETVVAPIAPSLEQLSNDATDAQWDTYLRSDGEQYFP
jgi:choline dehydrogenase